MIKIKFEKNNSKEYQVYKGQDLYGALIWDADQEVWVLWPEQIDDGVSYFGDLEETKEAIKDELEAEA